MINNLAGVPSLSSAGDERRKRQWGKIEKAMMRMEREAAWRIENTGREVEKGTSVIILKLMVFSQSHSLSDSLV